MSTAITPKIEPDPVLQPDAGDFFRAILLDHIEPCSDQTCSMETRLAIETRDLAPVAYCSAHAFCAFADWMVGV